MVALALVLTTAAAAQLAATMMPDADLAALAPWPEDLVRHRVEEASAAVTRAAQAGDGLAPALAEAIAAVTDALQRYPDDADLWLRHAEIAALSGALPAVWEDSLMRSYATGPREGWVSARRLPFALSRLAELSPAARSKAMHELDAMVGWRSAYLSQFANAYARLAPRARFVVERAVARQASPVRERVTAILAGADRRFAASRARTPP
ncbi:hypothetical protein AL346_21045 (plasmid) [Chelatococcus sp. CO-6]|nr:hypothetical protein AL346_21045 [Chelatococcus sp. CO-6]